MGDTRGITVGNKVEFTSNLLSIDLGPGILNNVYDGLGNPLEALAKKTGYFLKRGIYLDTIENKNLWEFTPIAEKKHTLNRGEALGYVKEGNFKHYIMIPFSILDKVEVIDISTIGKYYPNDTIA